MFDWFRKHNKPGTAVAVVPEVTQVHEELVTGPTVVYVRARPGSFPMQWWESEVHYDAWGEPFLRGCWARMLHSGRPGDDLMRMKPNGKAADNCIEWLHKSGPMVTFPEGEPWKGKWHPEGWSPQ